MSDYMGGDVVSDRPLMSNLTKGIICGFTAAVIWGAFPAMTRFGVRLSSLDMYDITFLRFAGSGVLLLPYLVIKGMGGINVKQALILTVCMGAPYMFVVAFGLTFLPVRSFAILTPGSMIVFSVVLSGLILKSRIRNRQGLGILLILFGVTLAGIENISTLKFDSYKFAPVFVFAGLLWASYTVLLKYLSIDSLHATAIVSVFSLLLYSPIYFAHKKSYIFSVNITEILLHLMYQGVLVSVLALFFFSKSVFYLGPEVGASFTALVPGFATILAIFLLDETAATITIAGLTAVTAGLLLTLLTNREHKESQSP